MWQVDMRNGSVEDLQDCLKALDQTRPRVFRHRGRRVGECLLQAPKGPVEAEVDDAGAARGGLNDGRRCSVDLHGLFPA